MLPEALSSAIEAADWAAANAALRALFAARGSRFALDPRSSSALRRAIVSRWPGAVADASERGNALLEGRFDPLGYERLSFAHGGHAIDWHFDPVHQRSAPLRFWADIRYLDPRIGDHKIIWELNRHQHFLALARAWWLTGDTRYRDAMPAQISSWMAANPPLTGINWASMLELAFRSLSWLWAMHALLDEGVIPTPMDASGWLVDLIVGLDRQLTHVEQNLSVYFSPTTHLTGEALALYVAGAALPELRHASRWLDRGRGILLKEILRQIGRDGGHVERSTHYHRYTLDFYLLALLTAERIGDADAAAVFRDTCGTLATFMQALVDDRGWMPQIGDDDGGMLWPIAGRDPRDVRDSLGLAAVMLDRGELAPWGVPEEAFWVGFSARPEAFAGCPVAVCDRAPAQPGVSTRTLDDAGFVTVRNERGDHLVLDTGAHGYLNGGHAHADALAVTLAIDGAPLLIDPGTATYTMSAELRDRMRSTALHNTLVLDGRPSSTSKGPFHWRTTADARLDTVRHNSALAWTESHHEGFGRARHRRSIVHTAGRGWLIVDEVVATGTHTTELHWHFDPSWRVSCDHNGQLSVVDHAGRRVWLLHDGGDLTLAFGDDESGLGWCSPRYGQLVPTCSACVTRTGTAPLSMVTWIDAASAAEPAPVLVRLNVDADADAPAVGIAIRRGPDAIVTLLRPGDRPQREARGCASSDYHTDARLLQYTTRHGVPVSLCMADASHVLALQDGSLSVSSEAPVSDLHIGVDGDRLELWSSAPPPELSVQGSLLERVTTLRLNGRELRVTAPSSRRRLTIAGADWREGRTSACVELPVSLI